MFENTYAFVEQPPLQLQEKERYVTLLEYVRREGRSAEKYEYHDGKIVKMPYARGPHNEISTNIIGELRAIFKTLPKKYRIFSSNQKIYIPPVNHGVYADALVVCEKPQYWDDLDLLLINPLLIVEVLSRSTKKYDREGKFDLYKNLPSFQEYILVRQDTCEVEIRFREEPGLWREKVYSDINDSALIKSIGCSISLAEIYANIEFPVKK